MAQFDVFVNPIPSTRAAYPFVVAMQSDMAPASTDQIIAPLVPRGNVSNGMASRLTPTVSFQGIDHAVIVPRMAVIRLRDLSRKFGSIVLDRSDILAAVDLLFFGV